MVSSRRTPTTSQVAPGTDHETGKPGVHVRARTWLHRDQRTRMAKSDRAARGARVVITLLSCCLLMSMQSRAWSDETGRITILEENDSLYFNSDKHYTQG